MPLFRQAIWGHIWKHTVEKSHTNAINVPMHAQMLEILSHIWKKHSGERLNKCKQCNCILSGRQSEDTFENTRWRKDKQMQSVWLCILSVRQFKTTFQNTHWRKVKQMQPMWFCMLSCRHVDEAFENTYWRKVKQMQTVPLCILLWHIWRYTLD